LLLRALSGVVVQHCQLAAADSKQHKKRDAPVTLQVVVPAPGLLKAKKQVYGIT
jgi:hypothetical protein